MNKETFLKALEDRLFQLPDEEKRQQVDYYREVLEDKIEDGMSEEEAVASFGDIDKLADDILQDTPLATLVKTKVKPKKGWTPAASSGGCRIARMGADCNCGARGCDFNVCSMLGSYSQHICGGDFHRSQRNIPVC